MAPALDLGQGQDLSHVVMEVSGQAPPFPLFRQGQFRGHGPELFLVSADFFFGLFLFRDILDHADGQVVFDLGAAAQGDVQAAPGRLAILADNSYLIRVWFF
jgi:hypothetical protein